MTEDPKVSRRYRELGAEEPPRELDDAILAAARRAAGARPGSAGRAFPQRWYAPLAAAAVLVLAVAVTLHTQIEQPEVAAPAPDVAKAKKEVIARPAEPSGFAPDPAPPAAPVPAPAPRAQAEIRVPHPSAGASGATAGGAAERDVRTDLAREHGRQPAAAEAVARSAQVPAGAVAATPERELERIAGLRAQGRHDEADRALADFGKRYPEYRIPEQMRARVERR